MRFHDKRGFTLIELMVVIAILAIVGLVVFLNLPSQRNASNLAGITEQMVALLREAQSGAATQKQNVAWGVYFSNATNTAPFYAIYSGASYASGTVIGRYAMPQGAVGFVSANLPQGFVRDVTFSPISGIDKNGPTTIEIYTLSGTPLVSIISISRNGSVVSGTITQHMYVPDNPNNRVEKFDTDGNYISQFGCPSGPCPGGSGPGQMINPADAAVDLNEYVYVLDVGNNRVDKFSANGSFVSQLGCPSGPCPGGSGNGQFNFTLGTGAVYVDANGFIYVGDPTNNRVEKFDSSGNYLSQLGCPSGACPAGSGNGQFNFPGEITVDASGYIYVLDVNNNRVEKFGSSGNYLSQLGCPSGACPAGSGNGQFNNTYDLAIGTNSNVYVADSGNHRVEIFDPSGNYVSQLGCPSGPCPGGSGNGQFNFVNGVAVDAYGNVYTSDQFAGLIQKFDPAGNYVSQISCNVSSTSCSPATVRIY